MPSHLSSLHPPEFWVYSDCANTWLKFPCSVAVTETGVRQSLLSFYTQGKTRPRVVKATGLVAHQGTEIQVTGLLKEMIGPHASPPTVWGFCVGLDAEQTVVITVLSILSTGCYGA